MLGGTKHDGNKKARFDLIPPEAMEALAELYALGANKYGDRNWEHGMKWGRVFAAMMRHAWAWFRGETNDREDGQHHLISVAWCALALYVYQIRNIGIDDRGKGAAQETPKEQNSQGSPQEGIQTTNSSGWETARKTEV